MTTSALTDHNARRLYEEELLVGEAMENVAALLQSLGISQRELASRLGVTEARVSQITRGGENLTLRSLAAIGWALGVRFDIAPIALSSAERRGTPSEGDLEPPAWLGRMRTRPALQQDEARRSTTAVTTHGRTVTTRGH